MAGKEGKVATNGSNLNVHDEAAREPVTTMAGLELKLVIIGERKLDRGAAFSRIIAMIVGNEFPTAWAHLIGKKTPPWTLPRLQRTQQTKLELTRQLRGLCQPISCCRLSTVESCCRSKQKKQRANTQQQMRITRPPESAKTSGTEQRTE